MSRSSELRSLLWPKGSRPDVWAVLDCARDRQIYSAIYHSHNISACLYAGAIPDALERRAPHLVRLEYEKDRLTDLLLSSAWGQSWGVFLRADTNLQKLRTHLRKFLIVADEGGRRLLFRYYDPRVLRVFLPTCTADQLDVLYGPVDLFWTEAPDASGLLCFARKGRSLEMTRHALGE
jgi:hypothetical protein